MCIFSVVYRVVPGCPIFVLTNRDESAQRSTLPPQVFASESEAGGPTHWFGGADARAGGTWFGVNEHGLLAAITNRRKADVPASPRSRGLVCRDALGRATAASAVEFVLRELSERDYAGFNLILLSANAGWVVEAADQTSATELGPGIHTIGNQSIAAADDARVNGTHSLVERMVREERHWKLLIGRAKEICALHADPGMPAVCVHGDGWGTVGSTIVVLPDDPQHAEYHYAAGPPCRTPYTNDSASLRKLFAGKRHLGPPS